MDIGKLNNIVQVLSVFSTMAVSLTAILALLSTVSKPVRKALAWIIKRFWGNKDKNEMLMKEIKNVENTLSTKIDGIRTELSQKIDAVSNNADTYERKRLKDKIFEYGNRARHGDVISGEDFRNLQEVFADYANLGGNSIAHDEMNYITFYYNNSGWLKADKHEGHEKHEDQ